MATGRLVDQLLQHQCIMAMMRQLHQMVLHEQIMTFYIGQHLPLAEQGMIQEMS